MNVYLQPEQLNFLRRTFAGDALFASLLYRSSDAPGDKTVIRLSRDDAELVRDRLTVELARIGFDKDYALTPKGELLEELIDLFHLC